MSSERRVRERWLSSERGRLSSEVTTTKRRRDTPTACEWGGLSPERWVRDRSSSKWGRLSSEVSHTRVAGEAVLCWWERRYTTTASSKRARYPSVRRR